MKFIKNKIQKMKSAITAALILLGISNLMGQAPYCTPLTTFGCQFGDNIGNFSTTNGLTNIVNNNTGCSAGNYSFDTTQSVTVAQGKVFGFSVHTGGAFSQGFAIWIDWNNDLDFDDPDESVWNSGIWSNNPFSGNIQIPANQSTGSYRMRVRSSWNNVPVSPCASQTYSEAEDYILTVVAGSEIVGLCYGDLPPAFNNTDSVTGGSGNYTFEWQISTDLGSTWSAAPGINDSLHYDFGLTLLDTTFFRRLVVDQVCGDSAFSNNIEVHVPDSLQLDTVFIRDVTCNGLTDGAIDISISGGSLPYTYSWSNSDTIEDIDSVGAGSYTVTVTDGFGCTITRTFTISESSPITVMAVADSNTSCLGFGDGGATAIPGGGRPPYSYIWSNGHTSQSITNLSEGTYIVFLTDSSGCTATDTVTIIHEDTIPPSVITKNITVYLNASGNASINASDVDNGSKDTCGIQSSSISQSQFDCNHLGDNTIWLEVTDVNGNSDSAQAIVTVADTIDPVAIAQSITLYLDANGMATTSAGAIDNGSNDNCNITFALSQDTFYCGDEGLNLESLTVTDAAGNSSSTSVLIDVQDTISPTLITKTITVQLGATGQVSIAPSQVDDGSFDNCTNQLFYSASKTSFDCSNLGPNAINITITDGEGNSTSGTATIIVEDNINPVAQAQNVTVQLDASGSANINPVLINNGSSDNCGIDSMWVSQTSFGCGDLGQNGVQFTVRDASGNTNTTNIVVNVQDPLAPIVVTQNITVQLDSNGMAVISPSAIDNGSSDNCGIQGRALDQTSFDCNDLGQNSVTLTVTDSSNNSGTGSANVTVEDLIAPIVVTQDITVQLDGNGQASITASDIDNGSFDNCSISNMSLDISSFNCSDIGNPVMVTLTVTDNSNNAKTGTAMVTVIDLIAPTALAQNLTIYLDNWGNSSITPNQIDNGSTDNCGIQSLGLDISIFDCADLGQNLVTLTVTDSSGNSSTKNAFVTVLDTIDPTIDNLPATITAYADPNQCATTVQWPAITASDNCNSTFVNTSHINGGLFSKGTTNVVVNVLDGSGNTISQSFDVVVQDTISPVISNVPTSFVTTPNATSCDAVVSWNPPTAFDNCGSVTLTSTHAPGATFPIGSTLVTYTATDGDGNSSSISFTVIVTDIIAPVISNVPSNITQTADAGSCGAVVNFGQPSATDNCAGVMLSSSHSSGNVFPVGATTVTFTAGDQAGNISISSFTITVTDDEKPTVTSVFAGDTVGPCGAAYTYPLPTATDNCGPVTITQISGLPSGNVFPIGITQNTFRISDANGNDTTVSFSIIVVPQGQPQLPSLIEICENAPEVDLSGGQNTLVWTGNGIQNGNLFNPGLAGAGRHQLNYSFTDDQGCIANGSIFVTVLPVPATPVIIRIASTTLSTTGNYATYQWYLNGVAIPGANRPNYSYTQGGNYQVLVGNTSGCVVYGEGFVIGTSGGGIGIDELLLTDLDVYPNPSDGKIVIDIKAEREYPLDLEVYSIDGKMVFARRDQTDFGGQLELDLSHLPDAVYMLHIKGERELAIRRIILY